MSPNLNDSFYLNITPTVDTLLRHFRAPTHVLYLWIDAVCLNQYDTSEKAHQIPQMGQIYREATDVKIWLGEEDDSTIKQYACLLKLERFSEMKDRVYVVETTPQPVSGASWKIYGDFTTLSVERKKDRVAALVGLSANDDNHTDPGFQLDYNTDWKNIYKQVASFQLQSKRKHARVEVLFHLFEFGPVQTSDDLGYPSWIPDWSNTRRRTVPYIPMKSYDISTNYLLPGAVSDLADLELCEDSLKIQPHLSENTTHILYIIDLFVPPSAAESPLALYALSFLVEKFVVLRRFTLGVETFHVGDMAGWDFLFLLSSDCRMLPEDPGDTIFGFLSLLGAVLRDFCLLDLRSSINQTSPDAPHWAIGIGPKETLQTDILIPLWRWEDTPTYHPLENQRPVGFTTMLVVRYNVGELSQQFSGS
ncbi:hypothetical protein PG989_000609 [Apiospora arundinis]